jgi:hypothetical protein
MASREILSGPGGAGCGFSAAHSFKNRAFNAGTIARHGHHAARRAWRDPQADVEAIGARQDKRFAMRVLMILLSARMTIMSAGLAAAEEVKLPPVRPTATVQADVPKLECSRPQLPEKLPTAAEDSNSLAKQVNTYAACVTRYVNERRAQAQKHSDLAQQEADAGNAATKDINEFFASAKQLLQKGNEKAAN